MKPIQRLSLFIFLIFLVGQAWGQPRNQAAALDHLFMSMSRFNSTRQLNSLPEHKKEGVTLIKVKKEMLNTFGQPSKVLLYGDHYLIPVPTSYMKDIMSNRINDEVTRSIRDLVDRSKEVIENAKGWEAITLQGHSSHFIRNPEGDTFVLKFARYESIPNSIEKSLASSERLQKTKTSEMYAWLPEYTGLSSGETSKKNFGLILRDIKPIQHQLKKGHEVIPLNVLWGYSKQEMKVFLKDNETTNQDLIIPPTIKKQAEKAGLSPMEWILNEYMKPFAEFTVEQHFLEKVQGGHHTQNLLAVYDKGRFQKFISYDAYDLKFFHKDQKGTNINYQLVMGFLGYATQSIFGEILWPKYLNAQMMKEFMIFYLKHVQKLTGIDTTQYLKNVEKNFLIFDTEKKSLFFRKPVNKKTIDQEHNKIIRSLFRYSEIEQSMEQKDMRLHEAYEVIDDQTQKLNFHRKSPGQISFKILKELFNQKEVDEFLFSDKKDQQMSCSRLFQ